MPIDCVDHTAGMYHSLSEARRRYIPETSWHLLGPLEYLSAFRFPALHSTDCTPSANPLPFVLRSDGIVHCCLWIA